MRSGRTRRWAVTGVVLATLAGVVGCSSLGDHDRTANSAGASGPETRFYYDASGRLAAVQQGGTTAVYRFDAAGNRVAIDHVGSRDFDPRKLRPRSQSGPLVSGVSPELVAQGATVAINGSGFDSDPMGNVVAVGGALGRVMSASSEKLSVQLPPVAVPGPVTVSTAYGQATSKDELVVVPAEVDPAEGHDRVATDIGRITRLDSGSTLLTFHGKAGSTVELHLDSEDASRDGCDAGEVGLAGPTGTIIEADAGNASWCDRPARLPMTGTYTATVTNIGAVRATVSTDETSSHEEATRRLPGTSPPRQQRPRRGIRPRRTGRRTSRSISPPG
jgi:YD repeat-containing protein